MNSVGFGLEVSERLPPSTVLGRMAQANRAFTRSVIDVATQNTDRSFDELVSATGGGRCGWGPAMPLGKVQNR